MHSKSGIWWSTEATATTPPKLRLLYRDEQGGGLLNTAEQEGEGVVDSWQKKSRFD